MCYSIFFLHILPAFCLALLCVYSHFEIEFWSEQKKAREAGWLLFVALTVLFLLFFSVNCLLTFKLVTLMCINHIQRVEKIQNKSHFSGTSWKYGMLYSVSVPYMNWEYYLLPLEWTEFSFLCICKSQLLRDTSTEPLWLAPQWKSGRCCWSGWSWLPGWSQCLWNKGCRWW